MSFGLCNTLTTFQRCMISIFSYIVEDSLEVFMDDFSMVGDSFELCLENLSWPLQRCEEFNLVLNWEKYHFMVKEGIVLGHRISIKGIKVVKAKVDVIEKLTPPIFMNGVHSFLGHAGFYRWFIKDFPKLLMKYASYWIRKLSLYLMMIARRHLNALRRSLLLPLSLFLQTGLNLLKSCLMQVDQN